MPRSLRVTSNSILKIVTARYNLPLSFAFGHKMIVKKRHTFYFNFKLLLYPKNVILGYVADDK